MIRLFFVLMLGLAAVAARAEVLVDGQAVWKYFKGRSEASTPDPTDWRYPAFDDASWSSGGAPFFYEDDPGGTNGYSGTTELSDMKGGYTCVFLRRTFTVSSVDLVRELRFLALSDDGFIAWINGVEVGRFNMPAGEVAFDGASLDALPEPVPLADFPIKDPASVLRPGTNVLAIQAFNSSLAASSDFLFVAALLTPVSAPWTWVGISEFMATNRTTLVDVDGDPSGWIELHNPTDQGVNLSGWSLTTDTNNLRQWVFPTVTLPAHDRIVVFASGKNRRVAAAELHTGFTLPVGGGFLALVDASTNIVSAFNDYPPQAPDVSCGRDMLLVDIVGPQPKPSPGDPNPMGGDGAAPEVAFSRKGGFFAAPFSLVLSTPSNAVVRYTLDGTSPNEDSVQYFAPIAVASTTQVRARAFQSGLRPGIQRSETYLPLDIGLAKTNSDLPAIVLYNYGAGSVPDSYYQNVNVSIYEPGGDGLTRLTNAPSLSARAAIHTRGSSTLFFPKQSFSLEFRDELDDDKDRSLLGLPEESDWVLYAPNDFDPVLLHNPLAYQLSRDAGRYAPRTRFVEVYLNQFGGPVGPYDYQGIYVLEEKIKWGKDRVPITKIRSVDKLHPLDNTAPNVTGGYMMKIDRLGAGESGFGAGGQLVVYDYPDETEIRTPQRLQQKQYLSSYMASFGSVLSGPNFADPTNGFRAYVDVPSWIDSHILNTAAFNVDALRLSAYFHKDRGGKLEFGPVWDFDRTQGSTDGRDFNPRRWQSTQGDRGTDFFNYTWWGRMFRDLEFWQAWIDRYQELREDVLSTNHIFATIDALASQVRRQQPKEAQRWFGLTAPRSGRIQIDGYVNTFPGTYQGEIDFLKRWYTDRLQFMDTNFLAKPLLSRLAGGYPTGAVLELSSPNGGTIYWTTNGADPRLPGGAVSPDAVEYSGPITLTPGLHLLARVFDATHRNLTGANKPPLSSSWSGPTEAVFFPATPPTLSGGWTEIDTYVGQTPTLAITVTGDPTPALQWSLDGVAMPDRTNATLPLTISQSNQSGLYTLTASNAAGAASASIQLHVTPRPNLVITEVQSSESRGAGGSTLDHQDWWELTNLGDFPVHLQGFRFDDDHNSLTNAQVITNETAIAPGESIVLVQAMSEAEFRTWWGSSNCPPQLQILTYADIGFGSDGDAIHLWNAAATSVTDTVSEVTFGVATRGVTFGYDPKGKTFGRLSMAGRDGAFAADVNGDIGSPGTIIEPLHLAGTVGPAGSKADFGFATQPGWQYEILYKDRLGDSAWQTLTNFNASSNSFLFTDPVNPEQLHRFYRIRVRP